MRRGRRAPAASRGRDALLLVVALARGVDVRAAHRRDRGARARHRLLAQRAGRRRPRAGGPAAPPGRAARPDPPGAPARADRRGAARAALRRLDPVAALHLGRLRHGARRDPAGLGGAARAGCRASTCRARSGPASASRSAGALLLSAADLRCRGVALVGDLMAVAGGAFAAGYMVVGSEVRRSVSTTTYTALCYVTTAAAAAAGLPARAAGARRLRPRATGSSCSRLTAGAQLLGPLAVQHGPAVGQPDGRQPVDPVRDPRGRPDRRAVPRPDAAAAGAARGRACSSPGSRSSSGPARAGRRVPVE